MTTGNMKVFLISEFGAGFRHLGAPSAYRLSIKFETLAHRHNRPISPYSLLSVVSAVSKVKVLSQRFVIAHNLGFHITNVWPHAEKI